MKLELASGLRLVRGLGAAFQNGVQNPSDILNHDRTAANLFHKSNPIRRHISFVRTAKLFTRFRKRRTRDATRDQINAAVRPGIKLAQIAFDDIPPGTVESKGATGGGINFNQGFVLEA